MCRCSTDNHEPEAASVSMHAEHHHMTIRLKNASGETSVVSKPLQSGCRASALTPLMQGASGCQCWRQEPTWKPREGMASNKEAITPRKLMVPSVMPNPLVSSSQPMTGMPRKPKAGITFAMPVKVCLESPFCSSCRRMVPR